MDNLRSPSMKSANKLKILKWLQTLHVLLSRSFLINAPIQESNQRASGVHSVDSKLSLKSSTKAVVAVRLANDPSLSSARVSVHRKEDEIFEIGGSVSVAQIEGHPIQLQLSLL